MVTQTFLCTGCQLHCRLEVTHEGDAVHAVQGNRCKRGLDLAHGRIIAKAADFTLALRVTGGSVARVEAQATEPVTPDVARAVAVAVRRLSVQAPIHFGDVLVRDAAGLGVDLVATGAVGARPEGAPRSAAARRADSARRR
ncbi:MAG: DUF1667 domain-containing protein [Anaerolineales bacterium]|nr:DUF1667 domain-containing protein [Anaerolineales bacterium]